jgi:hypothetical protein
LFEVLPKVREHPLAELFGIHVHVEELGPEVPDYGELDAALDLPEGIALAGAWTRRLQALVQVH